MQTERKQVPGPEDFLAPEINDTAAEAEAAAYADGSLEKISRKNEHDRREGFRNHAAKGAIIILWLLIIATIISIITLAIHYLTPWDYLPEKKLDTIKTYVFSSAVVGVIGGYLKKYLD